MELIFLGTGGGRFALITQTRRTGGFRVMAGGLNWHIDPGVGALVYSIEAGVDPRKINGILVSHAHPDHYGDTEVLLEAMTDGGLKRRGRLIGAKSVLTGNETCSPSVSRYHRGLPQSVVELRPGETHPLEGGFEVKGNRARHHDPDTVGFTLTTPRDGRLGYTSDTEYFDGLSAQYRGLDLLILCVLRPGRDVLKGHMCSEEAMRILGEARPKRAILTHFGMKMIRAGPDVEAKRIEEATGIPTLAARDGMRLNLNERGGAGLTRFL